MRTKGNKVATTSASNNASRIIISVRVSTRASSLEELRVSSRFTLLRATEAPSATILGRAKRRASATARDHSVIPPRAHGQPRWTNLIEITDTTSIPTLAFTSEGRHRNGEVVAVDEADVVEVLGSKGDLSESCGRDTASAVAVEGAAAVARCTAAAVSGWIEETVLAAPDPAGPVGREADGVGLVGEEAKATSCKNGFACAWLDTWPDCLLALVVES